MKFAVVFVLAFCVFNVNSHHAIHHSAEKHVHLDDFGSATDAIPNFLKEFLEKLIQQAKELLEKIEAAVRDFIENAKAKIEELLQAAQDKINEIIAKIEEKLKELEQQDEKNKECVDKYRPEFEAVVTETREKVNLCVSNAVDYIKAIQEKVEEQKAAIHQEIENLKNIWDECVDLSHPVTSIQCVYQNGRKIIESIKTIAENTFEAVKIAAKEFANILGDSRQCISGAFEEAEQKNEAIFQKLQECINGSSRLGRF